MNALVCFWCVYKANARHRARLSDRGDILIYIHTHTTVEDGTIIAQPESLFCNLLTLQCRMKLDFKGQTPFWSRAGPDLQDVGGVSIIGLPWS